MSEPTTIIWITIPSAAMVQWSGDNAPLGSGRKEMEYLLGDKPARYPVPAIPVYVSNPIAPLCVSDRYRAEVYYASGTVVRSIWNARHMASRY